MKNLPYTFRIIIEPDSPTGYHGFVPLLRGVHSCGKSISGVKKDLRKAIACHLQGLLKDKEIIPREENSIELVQVFSEKDLVRA